MGKLVALKTEKKTETEAPASVVAQGKGGKLVKTTATQRNASFSTAPVGAERKETTGTLGKGDFTGGRESAKMPTLGERVKNTLTGAGKQYGAGFLNAAGMAVAGQGGNVMSEVSRRQEETLNQQIESLEKTLSEPDMTEQERADTLEAIENAKRQRDIYSGAVRSGEKTADAVYQLADEVANSGARDIETAKRGAGKLGQLAVDVGVVGAQMGGDIAAGIATGGGALVPMFLRSAGGAAQEARQEGASHEQQVGYGLASGALSVATEKISNVAAPFRKAFGGGILDKVIDTALAKMNGSAAGKLALSVLSEGGEEMLEDVVQPVLKSLYNGKSIGQNYDELTLSEVLYDGLVGGILGGVGGGVEVLGGRLARRDAPAAQETDALSNGKRVNLSDYATSENVEDVSRALNNGTLAVDALDRIYRTKETEHIDRRSSETVGDRRVNAFQFDHPEMHQYYREAAARNMAQVRDAATALGKNGSRALTAAYNETAARSYAPQDAVRDFYQVYNAALNGKKDSNTTAPDYIRMAAQNAGERDARLATQAKYFGENAQLVRDENWKKAKLTSKQSYALDALAKVTGTEIRFADSVADGQANAEYKDGVITLALDAKDPVMVSAVHETIHRIRETAPRQYQELAEFVRDNMSEAGMEYNLAMRGRLYETDNIDLLTEETVADAFGRMLEDGKALEQFTTEHRSAAQRIRDALHDLLLRIRRALGDRELRLSENQKAAFRDLQGKAGEMEALFAKALETTQGSKNAANEGGEAKFSIKQVDGKLLPFIDTEPNTSDYTAAESYLETLVDTENPFSTILFDAQPVYIGKDLPGEYKASEYTKSMKSTLRKVKMQAATNLDEMLLLAENGEWRENVKAKHNIDAQHGWYRYTTEFAVPVMDAKKSIDRYTIYGGTLLIRNDADGKSYLYDLLDVEKKKEISKTSFSAQAHSEVTSPNPSADNISQNDGDVKKQYSLKEYTPEEQAQHEKDAISYFGKTFRWNETGYLTPNGTKLDFSGRHDGGPGGYRAVDHRDIREALGDDYGGDDYSGSMVQFMSEGNIRISPESGGINLSVAPTKAQLDALSDFISKNRGEVILDIDTTDGRTVASVEYPRGTHANKVLGDIKAYFEDGTMPRVSELAQFRYSLKEYPNAEMRDPEIIEPVNRVTDKGKYAYLVNDFRENGYEGRPVVVYESPYGLQALTGSHRVLAAREAGIEIPTVLIENPEAVERLSAVNSDDELQTTARELFEEGLIDESTRDLLAREEELNDENYGVPYGEQTRYSRSDREMLDEYIAEYGEIPTGEKPHRTVRLPRRTEKDKYVSRTIRTVLEAKTTPDVMIPTLENMVANGNFSYERYTDKQAVSDAESRIKAQGWQKTLNQWKKETKNEVSKEAMATGWALYNNAATSGDVETALDVLNDMVSKSRNAAQALQAVRLLKKQEPSAQLYGVQRSVENLQEEIDQKYGKNAPEIKVDQKLAEKFLNAETDEARTKAMGELYRDIGRQMPSRVIDKWNAWRYLAMLGNPRTHVRNIMGNAGFAPMVAVKNAVGAGLEQAVNAASGGKTGRTKAILTTKDTDIIKAARGDYANVEAQALGEGKYSESAAAKKEIEEGRVIFGRTGFDPWDKTVGKGLESFRKFNGAMLDKEDMWFSKPHYAAALAGYCKANGITAEQIASGKGLEKARNYAVREAQKATYRDTNAFSQMVSELGRYQGDNPAKKAVSTMLEGILPFRKTPANILVRGVEYSPIGMTKAISYDLYQVAKGNMEATEMLDHLSAGLTGTGVMALGAYMVVNGILGMTLRGTGGGDEDEKDFDELRGHQDYSLELPDGTSITLDWLAPEVLPLFVGANLAEQMQEQRDGELTMADVLEAISNVSDPLLQMSCLQSLNDLFDSIGYAASSGEVSALANIVASAATSYLTQAVPTFFGQIERTGENVRMTTYTDKNQTMLTGDMQYALGRASSRLPGVDYNQIPYIDAWGRTESTGNIAQRAANNFLNPAYTSKVSGDEMEDELERLYDATNDAGVLPDRAARYFNVNGERKDLTGEEYVKYATAQGQTAYRIVTELTRSDGYRALDDSDKAAAVEDAYKVAKASAKMQVSSYQPDGMAAKCIEAKNKYGIDEATFILLYQEQSGVESLKDSKGEAIDLSEGLLKMEMVYQQKGLSDKQRAALFKAFNVPESIRHYNKALVAEKLKAMRKKTK